MQTGSAQLIRGLLKSSAALALAVFLVGCAGSAGVRTEERDPIAGSAASSVMAASEAREQLVFEVDRWLGSRYRYGGTGASGFDCSGFVRRVFADAFDHPLPRTTRGQMREGDSVRRSDLNVADLVFFRTGRRTDHVGIYLGDGEFAHASSSSGVMISHLGESYWNRAYQSARRVLDLEGRIESYSVRGADAPEDRSTGAGTTVSTKPGYRVGW